MDQNPKNQSRVCPPPPQPGQYPPQPGQYPPQYGRVQYPPQKNTSAKAVAGMVLGICCLAVPFGGLICAILGLIFSVSGRRECTAAGNASGRSMALAGIICSSIGLGLSLIQLAVGILFFLFALGAETIPFYF